MTELPEIKTIRTKTKNNRNRLLAEFKEEIRCQIVEKIQEASDNGKTYAEITYFPFDHKESGVEDIILELEKKGYKIVKPSKAIFGFTISWDWKS